MCGIAGILTDQGDLDLATPLAAMQAALRHRGPDDEGMEEVRLPGGLRLGLAQTRLSILDLSPAGHQPMADPATGSWLAYNGEVYNHMDVRRDLKGAFRSSSDTETILKGWAAHGPGVLPHLRGMFALAVYDAPRRQLWLARDRLGVKPLYAAPGGPGTWVFASELRALLASGLVGRRLDPAAVASYLAFGAVPAPWTLLDGVASLLPGEAWCFDVGGAAVPADPARQRYWRPPFGRPAGPTPGYAEAVERLRPVLLDAVRLRMLADVPVGVFLSGGIDSSGIVAALAAQGYSPRTFSVVFGERAYDESQHARRVARHFGTEHTELVLRPDRVLDDFDRAVAAYDQPSIDGLNTYFIAEATRGAGVKVALSGLGGDELFAGYPYFRWLARLEGGVARLGATVFHTLLRRLRPGSVRAAKLGAVLRNGSRLARYAVCRTVMDAGRRTGLAGPGAAADIPLPPEVGADLESVAAALDPVNAHSLMELSLYLANMLLRDTDQMSMAHALEVREPLLDHRLVEVAAQIPGSLKLAPGRDGGPKGLFVDALPVALPAGIAGRPKMGFVLPWERWLREELRPRIDETLTDRGALESASLHASGVGRLWHDFLANRPGVRYTDVLCLVNLVGWVKRHRLCARPGSEVTRLSSTYV